ncbi:MULTISPECIES: hypothetical protein, partial [Paraburkholderia]|uniref:hypothetical protein n=1 Tax=Paraburkholderia TaxID=1822464 RepID=UPI002251D96B
RTASRCSERVRRGRPTQGLRLLLPFSFLLLFKNLFLVSYANSQSLTPAIAPVSQGVQNYPAQHAGANTKRDEQ